MSRQQSPKRKKALKLWIDSNRMLKPTEIAIKLGVSPSLVRKWKCIDKWDALPFGKRKRGAPIGSKNAKGNKGGKGAPHKNTYAWKHGEYAMIWEDMLQDVEKMLLFEVDTDPVGQINNELRLLEIRERRMLQRIAEIKNGIEDSEITSVSQLTKKATTEVLVLNENGHQTFMEIEQPIFQEVQRTVKTKTILERVLVVEEALTRIQDKKAKFIDMKNKLELKQLSEEEARLRIKKAQLEIKQMEGEAW